MPTLAELKASSPAYAQMSDLEFASKIYRKHYAGKMSFPDFAGKVGFTNGDKPSDPAEGMSGAEKFLAGVGKSGVDTVRGLKQTGTDMARYFVESNPALFGGRSAGSLVSGHDDSTAGRLRASVARQQASEAQRRQQDAPLMQTGAGLAGNITGTLAQILGPGFALRGTATGATLLPRTIAGNAAQGGVIGLVQPTANNSERVTNAGLGTLGGTAGAAIPKVVGATARPALSYLSRFMEGGAERRAGQQILSEAQNRAALMSPAPSAVNGVRRTLAEESLDPGVARLERNARSTGRGFDEMDRANNLARVESLRGIAGTPQDMAAAQLERDTNSMPFLKAAKRATGADTSTLLRQIDRAHQMYEGRPAVQSTLSDLAQLLQRPASAAEKRASPNWPDRVPRDEVAQLYNVRKTLGDLMSGKLAAEKPAAQAATRELMMVKNGLDRAIGKASPEFRGYLTAYKEGSRNIDRMKVGQQLIDGGSGSAIIDPVTGAPVLTPAAFSRQAGDLDAAAAKATGFRKAKASNLLEPEDMAAIRAIEDDLQRKAFAGSAGSGGNSHTFERQALENRLGAQAASGIPFLGKFADVLNRIGDTRVRAKVAYLLQNPDRARAVIASLPTNERHIVESALARIGGTAGAVSPALAE